MQSALRSIQHSQKLRSVHIYRLTPRLLARTQLPHGSGSFGGVGVGGVGGGARRSSTMADAAGAAAPGTSTSGGGDGNTPASTSASEQQQQQQQQGRDSDPIVQWVVLRRDLWASSGGGGGGDNGGNNGGGGLGWPLGPVVAQACHASAAALLENLGDEATRAYTAPGAIDSMHKVVLEVKGEAQLRNLSEKLAAAGVAHKLWVEQPEGFPTCLATKPYRRSEVGAHFKKLQLCKAALGK